MFSCRVCPELLGNLKVVGVDPESVDELCQAMKSIQAVVCAQGTSDDSKRWSGLIKGASEVSD